MIKFEHRRQRATTWIAGLALALASGTALAQSADPEVIEHGREVYEETAGGVGCAMCHGASGTGDPELGGPYIRGATVAQLNSALGGAVPMMDFIELESADKDAVHAYLNYLLRSDEGQLDPLAAAGKRIFEETAGGVGCAACHGMDAHGGIGPDIVGVDSVVIFEQLASNEQMAFIELTEDEVAQVAAYMRHLHDLESH